MPAGNPKGVFVEISAAVTTGRGRQPVKQSRHPSPFTTTAQKALVWGARSPPRRGGGRILTELGINAVLLMSEHLSFLELEVFPQQQK